VPTCCAPISPSSFSSFSPYQMLAASSLLLFLLPTSILAFPSPTPSFTSPPAIQRNDKEEQPVASDGFGIKVWELIDEEEGKKYGVIRALHPLTRPVTLQFNEALRKQEQADAKELTERSLEDD
jgi:hypothetical protein